jgi:hypothetical protein
VKEVIVPVYLQAEPVAAPKPADEGRLIFADTSDDELLGYGVPAEWLNDVKKATANTLLALVDHLPGEAAEGIAGTSDRWQAARDPAPDRGS